MKHGQWEIIKFVVMFLAPLLWALAPGCQCNKERPEEPTLRPKVITMEPSANADIEIWGYEISNRDEDDWQNKLFQNQKKSIDWKLPKKAPDLAGMVEIPAGPAKLGFETNGAIPKVEVPTYYIDINVVTRIEYQKCVDEKLCLPMVRHRCDEYYDNPDLPALMTPKQAERYCLYLGKRLPSEEEWEKAARGTDGRLYPWGNEPPTDRHANICGNKCIMEWADKKWKDGFPYLNPVGMFTKGNSPYGLNQPCGNGKEWTSTTEKLKENEFIARGGSWYSDINELLCTYRQIWTPGTRLDDKSVRCAFSK